MSSKDFTLGVLESEFGNTQMKTLKDRHGVRISPGINSLEQLIKPRQLEEFGGG